MAASTTPKAGQQEEQVATTGTRNVLTEDMPQPPGAQARRRSRRVAKEDKRKGPFAKYVGSASHRSISQVDWKTLNIPLKDKEAKHTWSPKNDYLVETSNFSDEQLDYLFCDDVNNATGAHQFLEVDYDDDGQLVQVPFED